MSIGEAADLLGVTRLAVRRWERGLFAPRADVYLRAMRIYGAEVDLTESLCDPAA